MPGQLRKLSFSVQDQNGQCIEGALVHFVIDNKTKVEARTTCERPLEFSIDEKVDVVDIEIFFGKAHEWIKVPMDSGSYTHTLKMPTNPMKNPVVIAATITAIGALIVGYWQFIYRPKHDKVPEQRTVQLRIAVRDLSENQPVANAQVEIEDGSRNQTETTDVAGLTKIVSLDKTGPNSLTVTVNASHFEQTARNLDRPRENETATITLKRLSDVPAAGSRVSHPKFKLVGTWNIEPPPDPSNALVKNGSFTFVPQADGTVSVTAHFVAEGTTVNIDGTCGVEGRVVHVSFRASTSPTNTWSGTGDLLFDSPTRITGRLQSRRGDDVPLVLIK